MFTASRKYIYRFILIFISLLFINVGNINLMHTSAAPEYLRPRVTFSQQVKLMASDKTTNDYAGEATSLSANGTTAVIGVPFEDDSGTSENGAAYVFVFDGVNWGQQSKLLANDKEPGDFFGDTVALSADGNTAVVGAVFEDDGGTSDNGAVYVFVRNGVIWTQQAKLSASDKNSNDYFGSSVSLSANGNILVIGANNESDGNTTRNGAVYIFNRNGTTWTQQAKLLANDKESGDAFGFSVSISANGDDVLVGATLEDENPTNNNGAAYTFTRNGTAWSQQAKFLANDKANDDNFGYSTSMSADGNTVIVGAYRRNDNSAVDSGTAYVFIHNGTTWTQQAKLLANDIATDDFFGYSVSVSANGNLALIGAVSEDDGAMLGSGAAYIFVRNGTTWTQQAKLQASDRAADDFFGHSVSISKDGNVVLIGADGEDDSGTTNNGAAYIFSDPPRTDTIGIYRPSNQTFYLRNSIGTGAPDIVVQYGYLCGGNVCNYPIMGDWNGDGIDSIGLYDRVQGVFQLRNQNAPGAPFYFAVLGNPNDQPMAGRWTLDMNHDGIGVFRPSNGILYLKKQISSGFSDYFAVMGNPGDVGVAGNWNGDGLDSVGVYRPSQSRFYLTNNNEPGGITFSDLDFAYGDGAQDKPFVGDWTGDGISKPGVYRNGLFLLQNTLGGGAPDTIFSFGTTGDMPLSGKWTLQGAPNPRQVLVAPDAPFVNPPDADRAD
jgi:hypothetical protein